VRSIRSNKILKGAFNSVNTNFWRVRSIR